MKKKDRIMNDDLKKLKNELLWWKIITIPVIILFIIFSGFSTILFFKASNDFREVATKHLELQKNHIELSDTCKKVADRYTGLKTNYDELADVCEQGIKKLRQDCDTQLSNVAASCTAKTLTEAQQTNKQSETITLSDILKLLSLFS